VDNTITEWVAWASLVAGFLSILAGMIFIAVDKDVRDLIIKLVRANQSVAEPKTNQDPQEHALSLTPVFDGVSKLATALKDLDRPLRYFVLGLGFFAVAAVAAGADSVAQGIASP
jgi:hypothetical protein